MTAEILKTLQAAFWWIDTAVPDAERVGSFGKDRAALLALIREQETMDCAIVGGVYHGMTPEEVLTDRDAYRRIVGG